jgi:hypothetical protein
MNQQVQAVMKPKSKTPRERKHKDGAANQLSARKMNQEPPAGSVILNFEQTTGTDLKGAIDEAKAATTKNALKALTEKVRKALERGDTLKTIKYNLANEYPQIPEDKIGAILNSIVAKTPAPKTTAGPAPAPKETETKTKAEKPSPKRKEEEENHKEAVAKIGVQHEKLLADLSTSSSPGAAPTLPLKLVPDVIALAKAVKELPSRADLPFNSNRVDHYLWLAGLVKKHGADKVTAAVGQVSEKNGGVHLRVDQKALVKP